VLAPIGTQSASEGVELSFALSATDSDPLIYSAIGLPSGATLDENTGAFSWTPAEDQHGSHSVTFQVSDGIDTASETINIEVAEVNQAPELAAIGNRTVSEGVELAFTISATDDDLPANGLTYSVQSSLPAGASFDPDTRTFAWTPSESQDGSHSVTFAVSDGVETVTETINIQVDEANQDPVLASIGNQSVNVGELLSFSLSATDSDLVSGAPNALSYSAIGLPIGATLDENTGAFSWTPTAGGTFPVTFQVSDGTTTVSETINIVVINPTPVTTAFTASADTKLRSGNATTNYGTATTLEIDGSPDMGVLLKWDLSSIAAGSIIQAVTFTYNVVDRSTNTYEIYDLKRNWIESQSTWNNFATGAANTWQSAGAQGGLDRGLTSLGTVTGTTTGLRTITLNAAGIAAVQAWIDGTAANYGILVQNYATATDGLDISSRETTTAGNRPTLTVTYLPGAP
jgi:hypothetical protein